MVRANEIITPKNEHTSSIFGVCRYSMRPGIMVLMASRLAISKGRWQLMDRG